MCSDHERKGLRHVLRVVVSCLVLGMFVPAAVGGGTRHKPNQIAFEDSRIIIEFNSTDQDVGVQFFLDAEGWQDVQIFNPRGKQIFAAAATGRLLKQGGGAELFLESAEPTLDELPLEEFFELFPE